MIRNQQHSIPRTEVGAIESLPGRIGDLLGEQPLRWYISGIDEETIKIESTTYRGSLHQFTNSVLGNHYPGKSAALSIVPTGVGCNVGGYAGDAAPATSLLASTVDYLITNPNAVNASDFIGLDSNVIYTEGSSIDLFCQGLVDLRLPYSNRIGLIVEQAEANALDVIFNIVNSVRAVHGIQIVDCIVTDQPIGSRCVENDSGAFVGTVDHPHVLFDACERLLARGVDAIAVTTNVQDLPPESYAKHFAGAYPNPVGGVEAIISHLITRRYRVPAAHAPLLNIKQLDLVDNVVDARGAGEMTSISGLACILIGLRRAPQIRADTGNRIADIVNLHNLVAVVAPAGCMGGVPVLATQIHNIPVIAVQDNSTILDVTPDKTGLSDVILVRSYAEAAGVLLALKRGINLESIGRPLHTLRPTHEQPAMTIEREVVGDARQLAW